jgi:hypothetical protein
MVLTERIWVCAVCGRWGPGWSWSGRWSARDKNGPKIDIVVCSASCKREAQALR